MIKSFREYYLELEGKSGENSLKSLDIPNLDQYQQRIYSVSKTRKIILRLSRL